MDATDDLTVRAAMVVISVLGVIGWAVIYLYACRARQGRACKLLRGRAVVCLSYAVNVCAMSVAIVLGLLQDGRAMWLWRNVTRVHAVLVVLILAAELLYNEVICWRRRG
jgi:hypothetical protein